jgi:hypothetical protein
MDNDQGNTSHSPWEHVPRSTWELENDEDLGASGVRQVLERPRLNVNPETGRFTHNYDEPYEDDQYGMRTEGVQPKNIPAIQTVTKGAGMEFETPPSLLLEHTGPVDYFEQTSNLHSISLSNAREGLRAYQSSKGLESQLKCPNNGERDVDFQQQPYGYDRSEPPFFQIDDYDATAIDEQPSEIEIELEGGPYTAAVVAAVHGFGVVNNQSSFNDAFLSRHTTHSLATQQDSQQLWSVQTVEPTALQTNNMLTPTQPWSHLALRPSEQIVPEYNYRHQKHSSASKSSGVFSQGDYSTSSHAMLTETSRTSNDLVYSGMEYDRMTLQQSPLSYVPSQMERRVSEMSDYPTLSSSNARSLNGASASGRHEQRRSSMRFVYKVSSQEQMLSFKQVVRSSLTRARRSYSCFQSAIAISIHYESPARRQCHDIAVHRGRLP